MFQFLCDKDAVGTLMTEHFQSDLKHFFNCVWNFITAGMSIVEFTLEISESVLCKPIQESGIKLSYNARIKIKDDYHEIKSS